MVGSLITAKQSRFSFLSACLTSVVSLFLGYQAGLHHCTLLSSSSSLSYDQSDPRTSSPPPPSSSSSSLAPSFGQVNQELIKQWPGQPANEIGHHLVEKGDSFVSKSRQLFVDYLDEFATIYNNRPDKVNLCGIRLNHAYYLWISVKILKPQTVIESGVNAGQSTYFIRSASNNTRIYPIDPEAKPICDQGDRWIDQSNLTQYYTGKDFQDFGAIDWAGKIDRGEVDPANTLVFLDDHLEVFNRWITLQKYGFKHVLLEDNYKPRKGATRMDKAGWCMKQMLARKDRDARYLWESLEVYAEFPPLFPPIMSEHTSEVLKKNHGGFMYYTEPTPNDIVAPMFRPDVDEEDMKFYNRICQLFGFDPLMKNALSYQQLMCYNQFAYMKVVAVPEGITSPRLLSLAARG